MAENRIMTTLEAEIKPRFPEEANPVKMMKAKGIGDNLVSKMIETDHSNVAECLIVKYKNQGLTTFMMIHLWALTKILLI